MSPKDTIKYDDLIDGLAYIDSESDINSKDKKRGKNFTKKNQSVQDQIFGKDAPSAS